MNRTPQHPQIDQAILDLYAASFRVPIAEFMSVAMALLGKLIAFDSAVWASGVHAPHQLHTAHLVNQPEALLKLYEGGLVEQDFVRTAAVAKPGRAVLLTELMSRADFEALPTYAMLCKPLGIEQALACCQISEQTKLFEYIALWRKSRTEPFGEADRMTMEILLPHLVAAWNQTTLFSMRANVGSGSTQADLTDTRLAVFDAAGVLRVTGPGFVTLLLSHFPSWIGPVLPPEFTDAGARAGLARSSPVRTSLGALTLRVKAQSGLFVASLETSGLAQPLSPAELKAAQLFAQGKNNLEVSRALGLSSSTVRNQLAATYRKLGVSNRVELVSALKR